MNIVKTGDGRFIEVQGTAEGPALRAARARRALALADRGIRELVGMQRSIVGPGLRCRCAAAHRDDQPGKIREIKAHAPRRRRRYRHARHHSAIDGARRNGDDVRGERPAEGALLQRRHRAPAVARIPGWRSRRSTARPASSRRGGGARTTPTSSRGSTRCCGERGARQPRALRLRARARDRTGRIEFEAKGSVEGTIAPETARRPRLRLRSDLFLSAVGCTLAEVRRRKGRGQPPRRAFRNFKRYLLTR